MVAIGHTGELLSPSHWNLRSRTFGLAAGVAVAVAIAWTGFLANGGDLGAARFASTLVLVAASFVFALCYAAAPLSRLIRSGATRVLCEERTALVYGFGGMMAVFLATILAPDYVSGARVALPSLVFAVLTALVGAVFVLSAGSERVDGSVTLRSLRGLSSGYFWLMFAFSNLDHMVGPHRPDNTPYGTSTLLLVAALVIRFADAFVLRLRADMSKRGS